MSSKHDSGFGFGQTLLADSGKFGLFPRDYWVSIFVKSKNKRTSIWPISEKEKVLCLLKTHCGSYKTSSRHHRQYNYQRRGNTMKKKGELRSWRLWEGAQRVKSQITSMKQNLGTILLLSLQMHLLEWMLETKQSDRDYTYQEVTSKLVVWSLYNSLFFGGLLVAANMVLSVFAYRKSFSPFKCI